jgi:hypothetical protein
LAALPTLLLHLCLSPNPIAFRAPSSLIAGHTLFIDGGRNGR